MSGALLIKPVEKEFFDLDGKSHRIILSRFDAVKGREIITKYLMSNLPKLGDYEVSEQVMLDLMSYIAVPVESDLGYIRLTTKALVVNHIPDWEMLGRVEKEMIAYNASFFEPEKISSFFEWVAQKFMQKILEMSMESSPRSATQGSPHTTNSEQSTT